MTLLIRLAHLRKHDLTHMRVPCSIFVVAGNDILANFNEVFERLEEFGLEVPERDA
ncbi:hypothetical protein JAN5088_00420 [Jannaschia rubra]|uniref:Uncharacterized protein n=1 Tax=Jannaschia rubra TaxID=282197 RepID=A0A0M6XLZ3_9RHOB|nr:hypothetical protein JAN5088_00420 [Jannaschia rubra]